MYPLDMGLNRPAVVQCETAAASGGYLLLRPAADEPRVSR